MLPYFLKKEKNSIEKKRITLEKEKFTPHYHSDGNEKLNSVSSSAKLPFEKKLFVCSTIFPNDEIKFVCKRKKNNSKLICKNLKINEKIIDSKKVENRSCDPCRIF